MSECPLWPRLLSSSLTSLHGELDNWRVAGEEMDTVSPTILVRMEGQKKKSITVHLCQAQDLSPLYMPYTSNWDENQPRCVAPLEEAIVCNCWTVKSRWGSGTCSSSDSPIILCWGWHLPEPQFFFFFFCNNSSHYIGFLSGPSEP